MRDDTRLHLRVLIQVVVQAVGPRIHQRLQRRRGFSVLHLHRVRVDEQLHPQILVDLGLALRLGEPALRVDEVRLDAVEVVFGLRVDHSEDSLRVGLAFDVCDPPIVAGDRDRLGETLPARDVWRSWLLCDGEGGEGGRKDEGELLHGRNPEGRLTSDGRSRVRRGDMGRTKLLPGGSDLNG